MELNNLSNIITKEYKGYFYNIEAELQKLNNIAKRARLKGKDPSLRPEPYFARDLAEIVEGLVGPVGVAKRIRELRNKMDLYSMAFKIVEDIIYARFGVLNDQKAIDQSIRTALAILTGGITAAPIQGISHVRIKRNTDQTEYLAIYFAGPIRSAGGTEQAIILVIADFIRRMIGLNRYVPSDDEINRFIEEIRIYEREVSRFQYHVSDDELKKSLENIPIEVTGLETDPVEVVSYRNLKRIETNRVRGGALRVVNDGIIGRSQKVWKIVEEAELEGWDWLKNVRLTRTNNDGSKNSSNSYLDDVIAGRPIFSFPSEIGGFRLRYGRSRNTGLASIGIHPATMVVLDNFLASGTQIRTEKPGKGGIVLPVDTIEPPIVKMKNGSVIKIENVTVANKLKEQIKEILFLGDLLVGFGEYLENNRNLDPSGYCEEWWVQELKDSLQKKFGGDLKKLTGTIKIPSVRLKKLIEKPLIFKPTINEAINITKSLSIPLHPCFTYFWSSIDVDELILLRKKLVESTKRDKNGNIDKIIIDKEVEIKDILEKLCIPHKSLDEKIEINGYDSIILDQTLNLEKSFVKITKNSTLKAIEEMSQVNIQPKARTYVGARMGRPEKAKSREMSPSVHVLFPIGLAGGPRREISKAASKLKIQVEIARRRCPKCKEITYLIRCNKCNMETLIEKSCPRCGRIVKEDKCKLCKVKAVDYDKRFINIDEDFRNACNNIGEYTYFEKVKGVRGLMSATKIPEALEKGILRAKHDISIFKDGTIRFDATNAPLTHFKPSEIDANIVDLKEMGYDYDVFGEELVDDDQLCELKVQDVIIPEKSADFLIKTTNFIDELLEKMYGIQPYYNVKEKKDLIGHLIIGFAPHTSAGVVGRITGFTKASVCYAHPIWHNTKRRDCDGDEDSIMMVLDVLINFSKTYLPARIGGMMDAPLILISRVNPLDVDEAHNVDIASSYPLFFYKKTLENADPKNFVSFIDTISQRLGASNQFQGYFFTHSTNDINEGNLESSYMKLGIMSNKLKGQMNLATKIKAVKAEEVAKRVLNTHFMRDIAGNLKAFTGQKTRCKKCNLKYRRIPLSGKCIKCNGDIILTVHKASIEKYLDIAEELTKNYNLDHYYKQRIEIIRDEIESLFITKYKQVNLGKFL